MKEAFEVIRTELLDWGEFSEFCLVVRRHCAERVLRGVVLRSVRDCGLGVDLLGSRTGD